MIQFQLRQQDIDFLKSLEGCKLKAYRDSGGIPTIGYGSTKGVRMGMVITQMQAEQMFRADLKYFENQVNRLGVARNNNQYAALVSFAYNAGVESLRTSTLLKKIKLNAPAKEIQEQFLRWRYVTKYVNGKKVKVEVQGLLNRREKEAALYGKR